MSLLPENQRKLEEALRKSYHQKSDTDVNSGWKVAVAREIRRERYGSGTDSLANYLNIFGRKFAVAAAMIALTFTIYTGITGYNLSKEIRNLYLANPVGFTISQMLN